MQGAWTCTCIVVEGACHSGARPCRRALGRGCKWVLGRGPPAPNPGLGAERPRLEREGGGGGRGQGRGVEFGVGPGAGARGEGAAARAERPGGAGTAEVRRARGGRRHQRRRGRSRARSCHPAAGPRQTTPARGQARTAQTLSKQCSAAPGRAAGGWATDGGAGGAQPRGKPATFPPNSAAFCLASVAAEGSLRGAT